MENGRGPGWPTDAIRLMNGSRPFTIRAMRALIPILCFALFGCHAPDTLERSSEHFRFLGDTDTTTEAEIQELIKRGEALYAEISAIIPQTFPVTPVIEVRLNGDLKSQTPFVDGNGTIQLFRYPAAEGGYLALLAHELVHAMGFDQALKVGALDWPSLGFYNEAWAEYVAQLVDPAKTGFPLYGFNEDVVVGHWVLQGGLTMAMLRASHGELNNRCQLQAYPMRASWFRYVDETFGRQASLDVMYSGREMTPARVREVLGQPLETVDDNWRAWVRLRYGARPAADTEAQAYRNRIEFYDPCL